MITLKAEVVNSFVSYKQAPQVFLLFILHRNRIQPARTRAIEFKSLAKPLSRKPLVKMRTSWLKQALPNGCPVTPEHLAICKRSDTILSYLKPSLDAVVLPPISSCGGNIDGSIKGWWTGWIDRFWLLADWVLFGKEGFHFCSILPFSCRSKCGWW